MIKEMLKTNLFKIILLSGIFFAAPFLFTSSAQAGKFTNTACLTDGLGDGTYNTPPSGGLSPTPLGSTASNAVQNKTCASDNVNQIVQNSSSITGGYGRIRKFTFFTSGDIRIESIKTTVGRQMIARNSTLPCIWVRATTIFDTTYERRDCVTNGTGSNFLDPSNLGTSNAGRNYKIDISSADIETILGGAAGAAGFTVMKSVEVWLGLFCISSTSCAGRSTTSERQRITWSDWEITYNNNITDFQSGFSSATNTCDGLFRPSSFCPDLDVTTVSSSRFGSQLLPSSGDLVVKCNDSGANSCGTLSMWPYMSSSAPMGIKGFEATSTNHFFTNGDSYYLCTDTKATAANTNLGVNTPCFTPRNVYWFGSNVTPINNFNQKFTPSFRAIDTGSDSNLVSESQSTGFYILDTLKPTATFTSEPANYTTGANETTTTPSTIEADFEATDASGINAVDWERSTNTIVADANTGLCPATSPTTWADAKTTANATLDSDNSSTYPGTVTQTKEADLGQGAGATDGNCYYLRAQPSDRPGWTSSSSSADTAYSNTATSNVFIYDSVLPTMSFSSCSSTNPATNNGWYNNASTLPTCTMTAYDNASRPADDGGNLEYSLNNSTWSSPDTITFANSTGDPATGDTGEKTRTKTAYSLAGDDPTSKNGATVYFRSYAYDRSGRKSTNATAGPYKIDTVNPSSTDITGCSSPNGSNSWYTTLPTCTIEGADATSGVWKLESSFDNSTWSIRDTNTTDGISPDSASAADLSEGINTVYARTTDRAGQTTNYDSDGGTSGDQPLTVKVDTVDPAGSLNCGSPDGENDWYITNINCELTATDSTSKPSSAKIKLSTNDGSSYDNPVDCTLSGTPNDSPRTCSRTISTESGTLKSQGTVTDHAGLTGDSAETSTLKLDKTNPAISSTGSMPSGAIAETVTFGATTATDSTSKIKTIKIEYKKGAGSWTELPSTACASQTFASLASATSSSCNFNTENLSDSSTTNDYLFRYTALDEAGNTISSSTSSPVTIKNAISIGNLNSNEDNQISPSAKPSGGSSVAIEQPIAQSFDVTSVPNWSLKICVPDNSENEVLKSTTDSEEFTGVPLQTKITKIGESNTSLTKNVSKNCNTSTDWVASNRTGGTVNPISVENIFIQDLPWSVSGGKTYSLPIQYNLTTASTTS